MGYDFLLKKSANEKLCRVRKRQEKLGASPGLEAIFTPTSAALQFRCEALDDAPVRKGDQVLFFASGDEVKILKQNSQVGKMTSSAAGDFGLTAGDKACPEYQLGEVVSDPSPLDKTFDVERRPPWNEPKSRKK